MKYLKILSIVLLLSVYGCKDTITYYTTPTSTISITPTSNNTVQIETDVVAQSNPVRGIVVSKTKDATLNNSTADIIWLNKGIGKESINIALESKTDYWITTFAYYSGQANNIGYSKVVEVKTN